ncbi:hypothetical protein U9M48_023437 [Paspalum notatum var. saurae]|uniref:Uncharacterized protein n=1 Tax=Paspalum notatum var. saurae TaxID=547442 RepID=A0AAQ3WW45_PASNO
MSEKGIGKCPKVTYEMLCEMRREVERCKELVARSKAQPVSLPTVPSSSDYKKKKRGISFNFLRNPYLREAFAFAVATTWKVTRLLDPQRRPIINFIAISEKAPILLRADNCEGEIKSKEYIADKLRAVLDEVGGIMWCKSSQIMLQTAKTPSASDEDLFVWGQLEFIYNIKAEASMIKNFIMNHGMRLSMFKEFSHLKLLSIAETRFASVVCVLKRFVEVKTALQHMVISDKCRNYKDDDPTAQIVKENVLSDVWWANVDYILWFTTPIYEMICLADTNTPCLHLIYEMWDSMIEKMEKATIHLTVWLIHSIQDLVFVHSNLRHLSRRTDAYKIGETRMWDVRGDSFDSLGGIGLLEVADLSLDEPDLQVVSFGLGDVEAESLQGNE